MAAEFVINTDDEAEAIAAGDNFTVQELLHDGRNLYTNLDQVELADDPVPDGDEQIYDLQGVEIPAEAAP